MLPRTPLVLAATLLVGTSGPVRAQSRSLSLIIPDTIYAEIRLSPTPDPTTGVIHVGHFAVSNPLLYGVPGTESAEIFASQTELGRELNRQIGSQLSTFPLGSSSDGFTFTLDTKLGTFSRSSDSFGPLFTQRAFTVGRRRLSVGMNYLRRTYDTYDGRKLRDPELRFYFPHNDCCPGQQTNLQPGGNRTLLSPFFEGDVLEAAPEALGARRFSHARESGNC